MFDFFIRKFVVDSAQKSIDRLNPKVNVHVPPELPLPSIGLLKKLCVNVSKINALESDISKLSNDELKAKTTEFKARYEKAVESEKKTLHQIREQYYKATSHQQKDDLAIQLDAARQNYKKAKQKFFETLIPEAFAVVRETGKRVLNMRHFDVQLVGGMVLHYGNIAEMTTGEGKTLVATLPAYLNAITGEGVHVVTVNDYLARRDREWMGPLYEFLGLTVGVIQHDMGPRERQNSYGCDITYGTNNEFGFDYLRDNMVTQKEAMVQRPHHFAIVDEVDSILVDEARTPLIISGPAEESTDKYYRAYEISKSMKGRRITEKDEVDAKHRKEDLGVGFDYLADEKHRSVSLTEQGEEKAAKMFGVANLHDMETTEYRHHVLQSLKAKEFFKMDVDYVVRDGEVIIVDEFTGRLMPGRRWSDGLHQAVEAKEGIKIERENQTLATITFQNYFRLYEKLSGMTGTAYTEANEFKQIYNLDCVVIPTNKKIQRINFPDSVYKSLREKYAAVVADIEACHQKGQPVLVGTISIEKSEVLSRLLKQKGIPHQVLNAKFHELEAQIIAQAGRKKAVTIATNMAGRGTDIVLGGNPEFLAKALAEQKAKDNKDPEETKVMVAKFLEQFRQQCKQEHDEVIAAGGLHVLGTERHESRRIDNQLRGRQGRQGDPGSSRFYISLEDDLMRLFGSDRIIGLMDKMGMEEGQSLEHPWLTSQIEGAQKRVENHNFEIRKHLLEYDDVMNKQREVIYGLRREILESDNIKNMVVEAIASSVKANVQFYLAAPDDKGDLNWSALTQFLQDKFRYDLTSHLSKLSNLAQEEVILYITNELLEAYDQREKEISVEHLRQIERIFALHTIDAKWKDHLYAMDHMKEGIGLRSFGQRDPLVEYKREGFQMFQEMYNALNDEIAEVVFKVQPSEPVQMKGVFSSLPQKLVHKDAGGLAETARQAAASQDQGQSLPFMPGAPSGQTMGGMPPPPSATPIRNDGPKVGRNDPCPCGSGKKYKKCCGQSV